MAIAQTLDRLQALSLRGLGLCAQHERLLSRFDALGLQEAIELIGDADPVHLFVQLASARPGSFDWVYVEQGPRRWRVRLKRIALAEPRPYEASCPCRLRGD